MTFLLGVAAYLGAAAVYTVAVRTTWGQAFDGWLGTVLHDGVPAEARKALDRMARPLIPFLMAPLATLLALWAVARGRWRAAVSVVPLVLAVPAARTLQEALQRPDLGVAGYDYNTFPSTHAAAAFATIGAVGILWPRPLTTLTLSVLALVAELAAIGNVAFYAHRHADVAGSLLIVLGTGLIAYAACWPPVEGRARSSGH